MNGGYAWKEHTPMEAETTLWEVRNGYMKSVAHYFSKMR